VKRPRFDQLEDAVDELPALVVPHLAERDRYQMVVPIGVAPDVRTLPRDPDRHRAYPQNPPQAVLAITFNIAGESGMVERR
jgi:hypothetical protein